MIWRNNNQSFLTSVFIILTPVFFIFFLVNNIQTFGEDNEIQQQNATLALTDYNFIATGDWYCNEETKKTINNILDVHPELIITTGDQVKESPSAACWIQMSKPIKDKMKIAIGNHDADFENVHFISMSTEHPYEKGSKQYEFIKSDLEKTSKNPNIDWIVVHQHKPLYSTKQDKKEAEQLRDI